MKKLIIIFSLIFFVFCGIVYANNDASDANGNPIEISALAGRSYNVLPCWITGVIPVAYPSIFYFDEAGNFFYFPFVFEDYTGYYTQTGNTFSAYCEFGEEFNIPHTINFNGTCVGDIFIYGYITGQGVVGDGIVIPGVGFFLGISIPPEIN